MKKFAMQLFALAAGLGLMLAAGALAEGTLAAPPALALALGMALAARAFYAAYRREARRARAARLRASRVPASVPPTPARKRAPLRAA